MCGIVGSLTFKNSNFRITDSYINQMRDTMIHRGPDGAGTWVSEDKKLGLGHRRLAIIDLSNNASQPMSSSDKTIWISFNGEIYNHAEIRKELTNLGYHTWRTDHSDTEVIIYAFQEWGIDCIKKFRGMFAFSIWDNRNKTLWLVRDRVGVKPLYYSIHHGRIVFASEIKALLKDPDQKRSVNEKGLYNYLTFYTVPAPETLFKGIFKLEAGTWLKVNSDGDIIKKRYWDAIENAQSVDDYDERDICEKILTTLGESVKYRKVSDVPVGVFLSGGIDSSTNAALFSESGKSSVKTFSVGYHQHYDSQFDETGYAKSFAKQINATHYEKKLTIDQFLEFLPEMVRLQDEPIADPVCFPLYYLSKLAKDNGVTVCQVGEGADELFWGYPMWKMKLKLQQFNNMPFPNSFKKMALKGLSFFGKEEKHYYEWLRRGTNRLPIFWGGSEGLNENRKESVLSSEINNQFSNYTSWESIAPIYKRYIKNGGSPNNGLSWMSYLDLNLRLPELLLMRVDKMSMGVSLESRVPFLDHKFVELAMGIPDSLKTKNGQLKYLLKQSVKNIIPDNIIHRKKQGFGVPLHEWFLDEYGEFAKSKLTNFNAKTNFFNQTKVNLMIEQNRGWDLWFLLNFSMWWEEYID
jgi:asparagine synthase (glutamine-hydrolysing)